MHANRMGEEVVLVPTSRGACGWAVGWGRWSGSCHEIPNSYMVSSDDIMWIPTCSRTVQLEVSPVLFDHNSLSL